MTQEFIKQVSSNDIFHSQNLHQSVSQLNFDHPKPTTNKTPQTTRQENTTVKQQPIQQLTTTRNYRYNKEVKQTTDYKPTNN